MSAAYIERAPKMHIENGVVCIEATSRGEPICWHLPLLEFRKAVSIARKLLVDHDHAGEVVPIARWDMGGGGEH
jgi:hypothetical protein